MYYLDSSAIAKLFTREDGSDHVVELVAAAGVQAWTSAIAGVEVSRGLRWIHEVNAADALVDQVFSELLSPSATVQMLALTSEILHTASTLAPTTALRSLDAIHVATALTYGSDWIGFVTYDARQAEVASGLGMPVMTPGSPL